MTIERCPSCRALARVCHYSILSISCWVQCDECHMRGPQVDDTAHAIVVWNALPRRRPATEHESTARAPGGGHR